MSRIPDLSNNSDARLQKRISDIAASSGGEIVNNFRPWVKTQNTNQFGRTGTTGGFIEVGLSTFTIPATGEYDVLWIGDTEVFSSGFLVADLRLNGGIVFSGFNSTTPKRQPIILMHAGLRQKGDVYKVFAEQNGGEGEIYSGVLKIARLS